MRPLLLALLCLPLAALADNWHDREATEALLAVLSSRAAHTDQLDGRFTQRKQLASLPVPIEGGGHYRYRAGDGLYWVTESPVKTQLQLSETPEHNPSDLDNSIAEVFLALIRGNLEPLQQQFTIRSRGDNTRWLLELTPKSPLAQQYLQRIEVTGREQTDSVAIFEANGDSSLIELLPAAEPAP